MNSYWSFGEKHTNENPSTDHIKKRWSEIQADLLPWVKRQNKSLFFTEIGWYSKRDVAYEPWDYTQDQPVDVELQRKLYQGFFESWWGNPLLGGFGIWEWMPGEGGLKDTTYTPKNKPAQSVIKEWLGKPRWDVE